MPRNDIDRVRGWWVLSGLVPFGFGAPIGFIYAAHRTGRRGWYVAAAGWALITVTALVLAVATEDDTPLNLTGAFLFMLAWPGAFIHALAVRSQYVELVRNAEYDPVWAARERLDERGRAVELVREQPALAREMGVGRPDLVGATHLGVVDVNHAAAEALMHLPGVDAQLAARLVAVREKVGGFGSAPELGAVMDLDAPTVERIRRTAVFLPF
jgi:hypothetical protein